MFDHFPGVDAGAGEHPPRAGMRGQVSGGKI
jgi:hypothetical protein